MRRCIPANCRTNGWAFWNWRRADGQYLIRFFVQLLSQSPSSSPTVAVRPVADLGTEAMLRAILQSIDDAVLLTDLEHRSLACNARFGEFFGVLPEEVVRIGVEELRSRVAPFIENVDGWRQSLETVYATPDVRYEDEIALTRGERRILRRVTGPVYASNGEIFGRLWTFSDVTESHARRRNMELVRSITGLTDPDPSVALSMICNAVSQHYGGQTVAKITIREGDFLRFHCVAGDLGPAAGLPGINVNDTYCGHTLAADGVLLVQNARVEPRFAGLLPATVGYCRYLGIPVRDETGRAIGTLCIVDQFTDRKLGPLDIELLETVAIRANAELARERYLAERVAESERRFEEERRELEETRTVVGTMNDAFSLLFDVEDTPSLLRAQAGVLRDVLDYTGSAVFLRRPGDERFEVAYWAAGAGDVGNLTALPEEYPTLQGCANEAEALDVTFREVSGTEIERLLGLPWAAIACLPHGEWGESLVVLGRPDEPPQGSKRHMIQLSAIMDGVRLVLAAHTLNQGILEAQQAVLSAQEKVLASEKLAVVGTLAASTAHDIRNITASLSMLAADGSDPRASLSLVREQLDRFNVLAHRLLSYARPGQVEKHPIDIVELLERVLSLTAGQMRVSRVHGSLNCEVGLASVMGDGHQLQHLFVNLVLNAVQAMDRTGGHLRLEARPTPEGVQIRVVDDGPGIPASVSGRLFQPFASSRPQGFGLGLFSARRIAEAHGGNIAAVANVGRGTTMIVDLPFDGELVR